MQGGLVSGQVPPWSGVAFRERRGTVAGRLWGREPVCRPDPGDGDRRRQHGSLALVSLTAHPGPDRDVTVRVVTVAFNPGEELECFLTSLTTATTRPVTVVVTDNGTEHDVVRRVCATHGARVVSDGRNRGYGAGACGALQNLSALFDFEGGQYGRAILNNCKTKIILNLEPEEAEYVKDVLKLSHSEIRSITQFERGEALLASNSNKVPVIIKISSTVRLL